MAKVVFIRHGEPVKTEAHHSEWDITEADKCKLNKIGKDLGVFDYFICSTLRRSKATMEALGYPEYASDGFFDEIEKPCEPVSMFKNRVAAALSVIPNEGHTLIAGHSRFMNWAHWLIKGVPALGFDYLESFEHEW